MQNIHFNNSVQRNIDENEVEHVEIVDDIVPKSVNSQSNRKSFNEPEEPFNCNCCDMVFGTYDELSKHYKTSHTTEAVFCQYCGTQTKGRDDLTNHMIEYHESTVVMYTMAKQIDEMVEGFGQFESLKNQMMNLFIQTKFKL